MCFHGDSESSQVDNEINHHTPYIKARITLAIKWLNWKCFKFFTPDGSFVLFAFYPWPVCLKNSPSVWNFKVAIHSVPLSLHFQQSPASVGSPAWLFCLTAYYFLCWREAGKRTEHWVPEGDGSEEYSTIFQIFFLCSPLHVLVTRTKFQPCCSAV